ncbi:MAG: hypothetical protein H7338_15910 [Candidatus Sericytochromatia bacterium]|nr:hypothetical protein [Candidatus Sericytochromatia bacterium]
MDGPAGLPPHEVGEIGGRTAQGRVNVPQIDRLPVVVFDVGQFVASLPTTTTTTGNAI